MLNPENQGRKRLELLCSTDRGHARAVAVALYIHHPVTGLSCSALVRMYESLNENVDKGASFLL